MKKYETWLLLIGIIVFASLTNISLVNSIKDKITIKTLNGLENIAELELLNNTYFCNTVCSAEKRITNYKEYLKLIEDIKFVRKNGGNIKIKNYQFYLKIGEESQSIPNYGWKDVFALPNGSYIREWTILNIKSENRPIWEPLNIKNKFPIGTYDIKLVGSKNVYDSVDWIIKNNNHWIDQWALWSAVVSGGFIDNFNRADNQDIGNDWNETFDVGQGGVNASITSNTLLIQDFSGTNNIRVTANDSSTNTAGQHQELEFRYFTEGVNKAVIVDGMILNIFNENKFLHQVVMNDTAILVKGGVVAGTNLTYTDTSTFQNISLIFNWTSNVTQAYINESNFGNISFQDSGILQMGGVQFNSAAASVLGNLTVDYVQWGEESPSIIYLNSPEDSFISISESVEFNCSADSLDTITNISLYIDGIINFTNDTSSQNVSLFNIVDGISFGDHLWTCGIETDQGDFLIEDNRTFSVGYITENSQDYNGSSYETSLETFQINITYNDSVYSEVKANLFYNGTNYTGTGLGSAGEGIFTLNINLPLIINNPANNSFFWQIIFDDVNLQNSSEKSQTVNPLLLDRCNSTLTDPYYINFTFSNEDDGSTLDAKIDSLSWQHYLGSGSINKTLTYNNITNHSSYSFCLFPSDVILYNDLTLQYSSNGFPQRRFTSTSSLGINASFNQTLYLLPSADGIYSVYQVQTSAGSGLSNVEVTVEKKIGGIWTLVESGTTDSAGSVTFWLNPDFDHRFTFTKTGYVSQQVTIRPSSSTYTLIMTKSTGDAQYTLSTEGVKWIISPAPGVLDPNLTYTFEFNITSTNSNLTGCKFELKNTTTVLSTTTGCTAGEENLSTTFNVSSYREIWGVYYLDMGDGYIIVDGDAKWSMIETDIPPRGTLKAFFTHLRDIPQFGGEGGRAEYSRIVLFFLIFTILVGVLTSTTNWDLLTGGGGIGIMALGIIFASVAGFFTMNVTAGRSDFLDQYSLALIVGLLYAGWYFHKEAST